MLLRIFDNLINNSLKHGTGALTITVEAVENLQITFINKHISNELDIEHIFDEFYTAEKFQQSQGLKNWVTPHSVGRCHEVTEGTGDRWEDRENMKAASKALNKMTASNSTLEELESAAHRALLNLWSCQLRRWN